MTESLVKYGETTAIAPSQGGGLFLDATMFEHAQRVSTMLSKSNMVPTHFQGNVGNCVIALNLASRWNADAFMVMQNMYIVHGKPGIEAKLAIAVVNATGKFTPIQYRFNKDKTGCYAYAKNAKTGELCEGTEVTIQMAKEEGWYGKQGSKWKTMPQLMLQYRSAMFFCRAYCPEALLGMQTREELIDDGTVDLEKGKDGSYRQAETTEDLAARILNGDSAKPTAHDEPKTVAGKTPDPDGNLPSDAKHHVIEETIGGETLDNAVNEKIVAALQNESWDPLTSDPQTRYSTAKRNEIIRVLESRGIEYNQGHTAKELHLLLLGNLPKAIRPESNNPEEGQGQGVGDGGETKYFHDIDELSAMSLTEQRVYAELAEVYNCLSEEVSPKAVNVLLKKRYPDQWKTARDRLGFSNIAATNEAADRWNHDIVALIDDGMKV
jgi:hypothetical protein